MIIQRPAKRLWLIAAELPQSMQREVKQFYFQLGKLDRPTIERKLAEFERKAKYANYR